MTHFHGPEDIASISHAWSIFTIHHTINYPPEKDLGVLCKKKILHRENFSFRHKHGKNLSLINLGGYPHLYSFNTFGIYLLRQSSTQCKKFSELFFAIQSHKRGSSSIFSLNLISTCGENLMKLSL